MVLYKSQHEGIFFEIGLPKKSNGVLLLILPGFPEYPRPKEFMEKLSSEGYYTVYPRYNGTFESVGSFLNNKLTKNLLGLIKFFAKNKKVKELYELQEIPLDFKKIILMGSSFGGSVGLHLSMLTDIIEKFVIISPVLDFKNHNKYGNEQDLKKFKRFLKEGFPNVYRFKSEDYDALLEGKIIPRILSDALHGRIILIHGENDPVVSIKNSEKLKGVHFIPLKDKGHISFKDLDFDFLKKILVQ